MFEGVASDLSIQDLKLVGTTGTVSGGGVNFICVIDSEGMSGDSYEWHTTDETGEEVDGWFDMDNWGFWDVPVTEGEGFYLYTADEGIGLQTSGQVKLDSYSRTLAKGYNIVGNCSPIDINVRDLKLEGEVSGGGVNFICVIDSEGMSGDSYEWHTTDETGEEVDGWFDMDNWGFWDVPYKAGEGLYIYCADENIKITLKSAITK